ncbi:MAG: hypothetical protein R2750_11970 [Bacteroidales bacterium]
MIRLVACPLRWLDATDRPNQLLYFNYPCYISSISEFSSAFTLIALTHAGIVLNLNTTSTSISTSNALSPDEPSTKSSSKIPSCVGFYIPWYLSAQAISDISKRQYR